MSSFGCSRRRGFRVPLAPSGFSCRIYLGFARSFPAVWCHLQWHYTAGIHPLICTGHFPPAFLVRAAWNRAERWIAAVQASATLATAIHTRPSVCAAFLPNQHPADAIKSGEVRNNCLPVADFTIPFLTRRRCYIAPCRRLELHQALQLAVVSSAIMSHSSNLLPILIQWLCLNKSRYALQSNDIGILQE